MLRLHGSQGPRGGREVACIQRVDLDPIDHEIQQLRPMRCGVADSPPVLTDRQKERLHRLVEVLADFGCAVTERMLGQWLDAEDRDPLMPVLPKIDRRDNRAMVGNRK